MLNTFSTLLAALFLSVGLFLIAGCAGGDEPLQGACRSDSDCGLGELCDLGVGTCGVARTQDTPTRPGNGDDISPDLDAGSTEPNPPTEPTEPPDPTQPPASPDAGTPPVDPGTSDSGLDPEEDASDDEDGGVVVVAETCAAIGDACDPSVPRQGEFSCIDDGEGGGFCLASCERSAHADTCAAGFYCWDIGPDGAPLAVCLPGECQEHGDCSNQGNCIHFDNAYALCTETGTLAPGASCTIGGQAKCGQGSHCKRTSSGSNQGVCARLCNPWAPVYECPGLELCEPTWPRTGLCTNDFELSAINPFDVCSSPGSMCDDAVQCFSLGSSNHCLMYCRPDHDDCRWAPLPDGTPTVCDNHFFWGTSGLGMCWPGCNQNADCGSGWVCRDSLCRQPCTTGDPVTDCCGGNASCRAQCIDGLCE
ncbi:MAG: hypothetical protein ACNA8W_02580 [Bradymonadaceae bacterium]